MNKPTHQGEQIAMTTQKSQHYQADTSWFHIFRNVVDNGELAKMTGSTIKVYIVLKSYTHFATGDTFPEIQTIAIKSGLSESQVIRCLKNLVVTGFLRKIRTGRKNTYRMYEKVSIVDESGKTTAVATWEYQPQMTKQTVTELKQMMMTGKLKPTPVIHIGNVQLQINTGNAIGIQINKNDLTKLAEQSPEIIEHLLSIRANMLNRKHHGKS